MKKATRLLSLLLAVSMLASALSLTACSEPTEPTDTTPVGTVSNSAETEGDPNDRANIKDTLPNDLNFGGKTITLLTRTGDEATKQEFIASKNDANVVSNAIYERNSLVEGRLNVRLDIIEENATRHQSGAINEKIAKTVQAGTDDYQLIGNQMYASTSAVLSGYLADLAQVNYLDQDMPWWNSSYAKEITVDDRQYLIVGELALTYISGTFGVYFNKTLWEESHAPNELYDLVKNGTWTLDSLISYTKDYNRDLNGDSVIDKNDVVGLYSEGYSLQTDAFLGGAGVRFAEETDEDTYEVVLNSERTFDVLDKMRVLLFENNGAYQDPAVNVFETTLDQLSVNKTLFNVNMLGASSRLRDMKDDYGILPMPKLNVSQDSYSGFTHDGCTVFGIPTTASDPDMVAAFMEAMCAESYRRVTPAYYDITLKLQIARDPLFAEMLDIITSGIYFDFACIYDMSVGGLATCLREVFRNSTNVRSAASTIKRYEKTGLIGIRKVIRTIEKLD